jgi:hypothetical protein
MGASGVDDLLKELSHSSDSFKPFILENLSQIPVPRAQKPVLDALDPRAGLVDDILLSNLLQNLAKTGLPKSCDTLIELFFEGKLEPANSAFKNNIIAAMAQAVMTASNKSLIEKIWLQLWEEDCIEAKWYLTKAVSAHSLHNFIPQVKNLFENGEIGAIRAGAAIVLTEFNLIKVNDILEKIKYAEADYEVPYLSVALANLKDSNAIPGLIHGLQHSFKEHNDVEHEWYAQALKNIPDSRAEIALKKWYKRI